MSNAETPREGNLQAPTRHPVDWLSEEFFDKQALNQELERVFDICHGCRRCVSLCQAFPTLFDLVDESTTMEVDGVAKSDYKQVVDQCYLCDMCFMTKCPYVPPHEWNVDFPHLMLRAKAVLYREKGASFRDRTMTNTDAVGKIASLPILNTLINALSQNKLFRKGLEPVFGVHQNAVLPHYHRKTLRDRVDTRTDIITTKQVGITSGKIALFATCYANYNNPQIGEDLVEVFLHNGIHVELVKKEQCCGMPKLELGDLEAVARAKAANIPVLAKLVDEGFDLTAPIPSCVLMYKQELPLLFPNDPDVKKVQRAFFDPFEYLYLRHKEGELKTDFRQALGDINYQVACHLRVQNIGLKTRDILSLVPGTTIHSQERCSGHDGTYAVRAETHQNSVKIAMPVVRKVDQNEAIHFSSDCPMAGNHIASLAKSVSKSTHPMTLLRQAYDI